MSYTDIMPTQEENQSPEFDLAPLVNKLKELSPKDSFVSLLVDTLDNEKSDVKFEEVSEDGWNVFSTTFSFQDEKKEQTFTIASKGDYLGCAVEIEEVLPKPSKLTTAVALSDRIRKAYDNSAPQASLFTRSVSKNFNTTTQYAALFNQQNPTIYYDISTNRHGSISSTSPQVPSLSYRENQELSFGLSDDPEEVTTQEKEIVKGFHILDSDGVFGFGATATADYDFETNTLTSVRLAIHYYTQKNSTDDATVELVYLPENGVPNLGWEAEISKPSSSEEVHSFVPSFLATRGGGAKLEFNASSLHPAIPPDLSIYFPMQIPQKLPRSVGHLEPILMQFERYPTASE